VHDKSASRIFEARVEVRAPFNDRTDLHGFRWLNNSYLYSWNWTTAICILEILIIHHPYSNLVHRSFYTTDNRTHNKRIPKGLHLVSSLTYIKAKPTGVLRVKLGIIFSLGITTTVSHEARGSARRLASIRRHNFTSILSHDSGIVIYWYSWNFIRFYSKLIILIE